MNRYLRLNMFRTERSIPYTLHTYFSYPPPHPSKQPPQSIQCPSKNLGIMFVSPLSSPPTPPIIPSQSSNSKAYPQCPSSPLPPAFIPIQFRAVVISHLYQAKPSQSVSRSPPLPCPSPDLTQQPKGFSYRAKGIMLLGGFKALQ